MLSARLKKIAELVTTKSVIDVGCDHALLCIYLNNNGIKCIGTDISPKVIENAALNLLKYKVGDEIKLINTNGLEGIKIKETDTIIIAGMGTNTIINILKDYSNDNPLIISSNNDLYELRKNIVKKGYHIVNEEVVYENKHYYVIIKFEKGKKRYNHYEYLFGPYSIKNEEYMNYLLKKYNKILNNLPNKYILKRMKFKKYIKKINSYLK